jgi:Ca2+-binding RTX toxin-like protein
VAWGGSGDDLIGRRVGAGGTRMSAPGNATLQEGSGADHLFGTRADNTILGHDGDDFAFCGSGDDRLDLRGDDNADGGSDWDRCLAETEVNCESD